LQISPISRLNASRRSCPTPCGDVRHSRGRMYQPRCPALTSPGVPPGDAHVLQREEEDMTIEIVEVEDITATRIHLDPDAGGA